MQIQFVGRWIRGFRRVTDYAQRFLAMSAEVTRRLKILRFWKVHGLAAAVEAFEVSRRTLYRWQRQLNLEGNNHAVLEPKSKAPRHRRSRKWPAKLVSEIKRLRKDYPNLGKEKLHVLLAPFCAEHSLVLPSARTIGRLVADARDKMRHAPVRLSPKGITKPFKRKHKPRKPKGFKATYPGHCLAFDTVERFHDGMRRYLITAIDLYSRYTFSIATTSHASRAASGFYQILKDVFPYKIDYVLTDNGSEFQKDFSQKIKDEIKDHWHTYPRTPKMNAHCERFNRTIQEEFVDYNEDLLFTDLFKFNHRLIDYLIKYNGERPHWGLNLKSPIQFLVSNNHQCHMWWPNTSV